MEPVEVKRRKKQHRCFQCWGVWFLKIASVLKRGLQNLHYLKIDDKRGVPDWFTIIAMSSGMFYFDNPNGLMVYLGFRIFHLVSRMQNQSGSYCLNAWALVSQYDVIIIVIFNEAPVTCAVGSRDLRVCPIYHQIPVCVIKQELMSNMTGFSLWAELSHWNVFAFMPDAFRSAF